MLTANALSDSTHLGELRDRGSANPPGAVGGVPSAETAVAASGATEESSGREGMLVGVSIAAIGAYIGYTMYRSHRPQVAQPFFSDNSIERAPQVRLLACVNFPAAYQVLMEHGLRTWLAIPQRVQLLFPLVTYFDETTDVTMDALRSAVHSATQFAYKELQADLLSGALQCGDGGSAGEVPCVVYRTAVQIDGGELDIRGTNAETLRRANGKAFHERHCVGYTVDGKGVEVLFQDVKGVIDARRVAHWEPTKLELESIELVLRLCCVPSTSSFVPRGRLGMSGGDNASPTDTVTTAPVDQRLLDEYQAMVTVAHDEREAMLDTLWRSPFQLFARLGATLRFSRVEFDGVAKLLEVPPEKGVASWLASAKQAWNHIFQSPNAKAREHAAMQMRKALCGHFYGVFDVLVEGSIDRAAMPASLLDDVAQKMEAVVRGVVGQPTSRLAREVFTVVSSPGDGRRLTLVYDLREVASVCTALQGMEILCVLTSLLAVVGYFIECARLVVHQGLPKERGPQCLLCPHPDEEDIFSHSMGCRIKAALKMAHNKATTDTRPLTPDAPSSSRVGEPIYCVLASLRVPPAVLHARMALL